MIKKYHVSKNLFDCEIEQGTWNVNTNPPTKASVNNRCRTSNFISIEENTQYTVSLSNTEIMAIIHFLDDTKTFISETQGWEVTPRSFTTPSDCKYIDIIFKKGADINFTPSECGNLMLNTGSTALPYEPYGNIFKDWFYRKYETATDIITTLPKEIITDGQPIGANLLNPESTVVYSGTTISGQEFPAGTYYLCVDSGGRMEVLDNGTQTTIMIGDSRVYTSTGSIIAAFASVENGKKCMVAKSSTAVPFQPYSNCTIKGNMSQSGTPTPTSPIYPSECGERTSNLFDYTTMKGGKTGYYLDASGNEIQNGYWSITKYIPVDGTVFTLARTFEGNSPSICLYDANKTYIAGVAYQGERVVTISSNTNAAYIRFTYYIGDPLEDTSQTMLNTGSTALPYEPYGYKLPISSGGTTTNVYLGEVQSTRKIKKLVFDGTEEWTNPSSRTSNAYFRTRIGAGTSTIVSADEICSHYVRTIISTSTIDIGFCTQNSESANSDYLAIRPDNASQLSIDNFKTYLQQQYAAGTPVTIWYVLATPITATLNEPIRKIGDYADSVSVTGIPTTGTAEQFDIGTTLKPSELSLTYHGWHEHSDTKYT